ncbi:MAG: hypothetical protein ACHQYP_09055 [Nitrospiria bacterium]
MPISSIIYSLKKSLKEIKKLNIEPPDKAIKSNRIPGDNRFFGLKELSGSKHVAHIKNIRNNERKMHKTENITPHANFSGKIFS